LAELGGPVLGVGFVVTKDNWPEIYEAALNALEDGAANFRISATFQTEGADYFSLFYGKARDLCLAAKSLETNDFTIFNLFGDRIDDLKQQSPSNPFCPLQQLVTYIGADLWVYRCCVLAYNEAGRLGSLENKTFQEFWESPEVAYKLAEFNAMDCPLCMHNKKNEVIRYAASNEPQHVNFL
jgi:hypothetical protein